MKDTETNKRNSTDKPVLDDYQFKLSELNKLNNYLSLAIERVSKEMNIFEAIETRKANKYIKTLNEKLTSLQKDLVATKDICCKFVSLANQITKSKDHETKKK